MRQQAPKYLIPFFLFFLTLLGCSSQEQEHRFTWTQYGNGRFGYCLQYPVNLLIPQGESENGDGQSFISEDKGIRLTVYGSHNINEGSIEQELQFRIDYASEKGESQTIDTKVMTDTSYVIAGLLDERHYQEKVVLREGIFLTIYCEYSPANVALAEAAFKKSVEEFPDCFYKP